TREPASAAAHIEHVVLWFQLHARENRRDDRQVVLLHALAAPGLGPTIEFVAQPIVMCGFGHNCLRRGTRVAFPQRHRRFVSSEPNSRSLTAVRDLLTAKAPLSEDFRSKTARPGSG